MQKLSAYGVTGNINQWIRQFLTGRTQKVKVNNDLSSKASVLSGIPQGSILGPVLFTVFINDLPECMESTCKIFADDTKIYDKSSRRDIIQDDINKLQEWSDKWHLYFNVSKCKVMHIGKKNPNFGYTMNIEGDSHPIKDCTEEKDLGVTFDTLLTFDSHIENIISKANQMLGLIKRTFSYLNKDIFTKLYKSLVRPHLEYGNAIWHPFLKRQSIVIEKVQRRATKLLRECHSMSYSQRLTYLELFSLKGRRVRGDLIETYKIFNKLVDVDPGRILALPKLECTRNSQRKIYVNHCNTNKRKNTFSNRVAPFWNPLPDTFKFAPTTNGFKNLLDGYPKLVERFVEFDE